jgi:hypothetical protein
MTDDDSIHFGTDEELLSGYVLGRLDAPEREKMDRHAALCAPCAESLRREMLIAAGARRLGRETLKGDLRKRIREADAPVHWLRITGTAAALCVVAGLGAYYMLFSRTGNPLRSAAGSRPIGGTSGQIAQNERSTTPEGPARRGNADKVVQAPSTVPSPAVAHAEAKQKGDLQTLQADRYNPVNDEPAAGGIARPETLRGAVKEESAGEFWSDGIVEQGEGSTGAGAAKKSMPEAAERSLLLKSNAAQDAASVRKDAPAAVQGAYFVRQRPASALPSDRETSVRDRMRIPTRVEKNGQRTTLTMYLDSLVDENDLQRAQVDALRDDSVVVTLGGKKILYRFPHGGETQSQQPPK